MERSIHSSTSYIRLNRIKNDPIDVVVLVLWHTSSPWKGHSREAMVVKARELMMHIAVDRTSNLLPSSYE